MEREGEGDMERVRRRDMVRETLVPGIVSACHGN